MRKSSGLCVGIEGFASAGHCPDDRDASSGKGDEGLGVVFSLATFAVVEGLGERVLAGDCAEGALLEDTLQRLVAAEGAAQAVALELEYCGVV